MQIGGPHDSRSGANQASPSSPASPTVLTQRHARLALATLGLAACATASHTTVESAPSEARFADVGSIVMADSGEGSQILNTARIRYPEIQRTTNVEAAFAFAAVLDTTGKAEYSTISFIGNAQTPFHVEVCRWLRWARFEPVRRDGVARRALIVGELSFTLHHTVEDAEHELPFRTVDSERIRRSLHARGVALSVQALETHPHCR
jgi:hypothetical protein